MIDVEVLLPEGWVQLPTSPGTERLRARLIDDLVREFVPDSLPRDRAEPWRRELRKQLAAAADDAAGHGARSVLLPLVEYGTQRLPGSMLLTVLEDDPTVDPEDLLAALLAGAGDEGTYLEVGGAPAVRVASVVDSHRVGRSQPSVRVTYYVAHPDTAGVWALLTFTVLTDGDVAADGVVVVTAMFDAVAGTLQWCEPVGTPEPDDLPGRVEAGHRASV
ncbi:hypothetical protein [Cellulomonas shaoxiangyii]|uniref:Uncharacterized protein n=1 Tax=Cellulomonas shaoxiangyii TaxID=2566013 RepID=A0A4P7SQ68_9CELL|nr:hypothetical protein [Cellulomonas shaoxiangyii]QCB94903.1 hypothetical protein E5225_16375 [Cellulomonas shaoxiangyii]TGY79084.1 hypothetical protein E5226_15745 [Cellulomonas shaoxiangyii]